MTTIVGVVKDGVATIAADSTVISVDRPYTHPFMKKITNNHGFLIAGAGDSYACDIIQYRLVPPTPNASEKRNIYAFMINKFVPAMLKALEVGGYKKDPEDKDSGYEMLIAYAGEIFDVSSEYSVTMKEDGIYGVGNGSKYAIGALYAGATIEQALQIAADNDMYTGSPFQIEQSKKIKRGT